jgi:anti-sigma factor RsiW
MKVTRDVVYDLLPAYFAGELSADSKTLVDDFFASDPEFARMADRFRKLYNERRTESGNWAGREKVVFERARAFRTRRDRMFGLAVGCTFGLLLTLFLGALIPRFAPNPTFFGFMRPPFSVAAIVLGGIALVAWIGWLADRLRPSTPDYRPPTAN